jgi:hypothetical protein
MERLTRGLQLYIFGVIGASVVAVYLALLAAPPVL